MGFIDNERYNDVDSNNRSFGGSSRFAADDADDSRTVNFRSYNGNNGNNRGRRNNYNDGMHAAGSDSFHRVSNGSFPRREFARFDNSDDRVPGNGSNSMYFNGSAGAGSSFQMQEQQPYRKFNGNGRMFVADQQQNSNRRADGGGRIPDTYEILDDNKIVERSALSRNNTNGGAGQNVGNQRFRTNYGESRAPYSKYDSSNNTTTNYQRQYVPSTSFRPTVEDDIIRSRGPGYFSSNANAVGNSSKNSVHQFPARQVRRFQPYGCGIISPSDYSDRGSTYNRQQRTVGYNNNNFRSRNFGQYNNSRSDADTDSRQQSALVQDRYRCQIQPPPSSSAADDQQQSHASKSSTNLFARNDERSGSLSRRDIPSPQRRRRSLTPPGNTNSNGRFVERSFNNADDRMHGTGNNGFSDERRRRNSGGAAENDDRQQNEEDYFRGMTRRRQSSYTQREMSPPTNLHTNNMCSSPLSQRSLRGNSMQKKPQPSAASFSTTRRSVERRNSLGGSRRTAANNAAESDRRQPHIFDADFRKTGSNLTPGAGHAGPNNKAAVEITLNDASPPGPLSTKPVNGDDDMDDLDAEMDNASEFLSPTLIESSPLTTTSLSIRSISRSDGSASRAEVRATGKNSDLAVTDASSSLKPPSRASSTDSSSRTVTTAISAVPVTFVNNAASKVSTVDSTAEQLPPMLTETLPPPPLSASRSSTNNNEQLVPIPKISNSNSSATPPLHALLQPKTTVFSLPNVNAVAMEPIASASLLSNNSVDTSSSLSSFMQSLPTIMPELSTTSTFAASLSSNKITSTSTAAFAGRKKSTIDFDYADPRFESAMLSAAAHRNSNMPSKIHHALDSSKSALDPSLVNKQPATERPLAVEPTKTTAVKSEFGDPNKTSTTMISPPASSKMSAALPSAVNSSPRTLAAARTLSFMSTLLPPATTTVTAASTTTISPAVAKTISNHVKSSVSEIAPASNSNIKHSLFSKADTPVVVVKPQQSEEQKLPPAVRPVMPSISVAASPVDAVKVAAVAATPAAAAAATTPTWPAPPVITEKDKKKFDKFIRFVKDPNGGCTSVQVQWADVVEHFTTKYSENTNANSTASAAESTADSSKKIEARLQQFVHYFYTHAFAEDEHGFPRYTMGILRGAARSLPCFLNFLERRHPNMSVKVGSLLNDNETLSKSLREFGGKFREGLDVLSGTSNTCGPMHAISCVGRKGEESGALLNDLLDTLESHVALRSVMPWGECSHLYGMKRGESDDGPILWIRPGEQTIAAAELADAEWRNVSDLGGPDGGADGSGTSGGSSRRAAGVARLRRELKDLGLSAYSRYSLQPQREHVYEDRTRPHADHAGGGSLYLPTAAVGILKAIQPRVFASSRHYVNNDDDGAESVADERNANESANSILSENDSAEKTDAKNSATPGKKRRQRRLTDSARSVGSGGGGGGGRTSRAASRASDHMTDAGVESDGTVVAPDFVHGRVTKDVVCFDAKSQQDLSNLLQVDYFEKPVKQCAHFVSWPKLNWLRRQGIQYSRLLLEDGDIYVIPRGVVHQFNTVAAVCSIAWHVRLRQYYDGEIVPFSFMLNANKRTAAAVETSPSKSDSHTNVNGKHRKNVATTLADAYTSTPADRTTTTPTLAGKQSKKHRFLSGGTTTSGSSSTKTDKSPAASSLIKKKRHHQHRFLGDATAAAKAAMRLKKNKLEVVHTPVSSSAAAEKAVLTRESTAAVVEANAAGMHTETAVAVASAATTKPLGMQQRTSVSEKTAFEQPHNSDDDSNGRKIVAGVSHAVAAATSAAEREKLKRYLSLDVLGSSGMSEHESKKLRKKLKKQHKQQQLELIQAQSVAGKNKL